MLYYKYSINFRKMQYLNKNFKKFSDVGDGKVEEIYGKIKKVNNNVKIIKL